MGMRSTLKSIWAIRSLILVAVAFIAPIHLIMVGTMEARCAYVMLSMAIMWLTEALPISVVALMPVFLLPMLGVKNGRDVSSKYINDTNMLFMGGLIVAVAMEEVNLHRRIAMGMTMLMGSRTNMLMLSLMASTCFLSMWISNTAATSMMLPIIIAITETLTKLEKGESIDDDNDKDEGTEQKGTVSPNDIHLKEDDPEYKKREAELTRMRKGFTLSVAYAANCGGIATLTGTPPNLVLQGTADEFFKKYGFEDAGITYAKWMGFGIPLSVVIVLLAWVWLQILFLRGSMCAKNSPERNAAVSHAVRKEWKKLGSISFGEIVVLILFVILALLWIFRDLPGVGGWGNLFTLADGSDKSTARDSTAALFIATLLFILPRNLPNIFCWYKSTDNDGRALKPSYKPILTWEVAEKKVAWGVIILLGGGFALADACTSSGLSRWVGCELRVFKDMEPWVMNLVLSFIVAGATEITSNTATATLLMPIMFELALTVGQHPLYLMMTACVACSFAFMLPVATAPNAIVFSTGFVRVPDMATAGIVMNILGVAVLTLAINTWGKAIFDLDNIPPVFANADSSTQCGGVVTTLNPLINSTANVTMFP